MVIDPGNDLTFAAVCQEQAGRDVHLPQLHRRRALPPAVLVAALTARYRLNQPVADQHPVDRGPGQARIAAPVQLEYQAARAPPAVRPPQFADHRLNLRGYLPRMTPGGMRAIGQPADAIRPIPRHPPVHGLTGHPIPLRHLDHRNPGQDFQHRVIPLLHHVQLPKHERERHRSSGATVSHIKRSRAHATARSTENLAYALLRRVPEMSPNRRQ